MYNVYGSQNEFVERVTRVFILCMRSLGQNGPLRQNTVFAVTRIECIVSTDYFIKNVNLHVYYKNREGCSVSQCVCVCVSVRPLGLFRFERNFP